MLLFCSLDAPSCSPAVLSQYSLGAPSKSPAPFPELKWQSQTVSSGVYNIHMSAIYALNLGLGGPAALKGASGEYWGSTEEVFRQRRASSERAVYEQRGVHDKK